MFMKEKYKQKKGEEERGVKGRKRKKIRKEERRKGKKNKKDENFSRSGWEWFLLF